MAGEALAATRGRCSAIDKDSFVKKIGGNIQEEFFQGKNHLHYTILTWTYIVENLLVPHMGETVYACIICTPCVRRYSIFGNPLVGAQTSLWIPSDYSAACTPKCRTSAGRLRWTPYFYKYQQVVFIGRLISTSIFCL